MSVFQSHASTEFWNLYQKLPSQVRRAADKQFILFEQNPNHPSLHLKQVGDLWSARVNNAYRALALREGSTFYWFWIGPHGEYDKILRRGLSDM